MNSLRSLLLLIIAVISALNILSQERSPQNSKLAQKEELRFQNLLSEKSIDIKAFGVNAQSQLSLINLRTLNLSQRSTSKQPLADQPVAVPNSAKPVRNRFGEIEPFNIKSDLVKEFEQNRVFTLRSFDVMSSRKSDLSDVK